MSIFASTYVGHKTNATWKKRTKKQLIVVPCLTLSTKVCLLVFCCVRLFLKSRGTAINPVEGRMQLFELPFETACVNFYDVSTKDKLLQLNTGRLASPHRTSSVAHIACLRVIPTVSIF